jgi:nucleotide-binding universal stress UspA family protein
MKILLAIDNSKFSQIAIQAVAKQFRTKRTQVRVLHVVEPISTYISVDMIPHFVAQIAQVEQERRKEAKEFVQRAARHLRKVGFRTSEIVEQGDAKSMIVDYAANWHADVIVLGSHGWKGLGRFLMGSVSEAVTRHAGCSVEVVRSRSTVKPARRRSSQP